MADVLQTTAAELRHLAPLQLSTMEQNSVVTDVSEAPTAREMIEDLADDHERVAHRLHALVELAGKHGDPVTDDLATGRSAFHEQAAWMLRATAAT